MLTLIITDTHFDPDRQSGTTMESRAALDEFILANLQKVLREVAHDELIIAGDLFHKVSVSDKTISRCYNILKNEKGVILRGNHCEPSMRFGHISSLQLLGELLPSMKVVFDGPETIGDWHFLPHCFDQATFNSWLESVPDNKIVVCHCNVDNNFTLEADHSLNISRSQLDSLRAKNCRVVIGHEHAAKDLDKVTILGCLTPTSVADCLGGSKRCALVEGREISFVETWPSQDYLEVDFSELDTIGSQNFVRVVGVCETHEYPKISREIAKLRAASKAFIISNAVKIRVNEDTELKQSEVTSFNILNLLIENLPEQYKKEVQECL